MIVAFLKNVLPMWQTSSQDSAISLILNLISDSSQNSTTVAHCVVYTEDQKGDSSSSQTDFSCDIRHVCSSGVAQVKVTLIFHFFCHYLFWMFCPEDCKWRRTKRGKNNIVMITMTSIQLMEKEKKECDTRMSLPLNPAVTWL